MASSGSVTVLTSSANWTLQGDVKHATRSQIEYACPLPPGTTAMDPILLTFNGNGGLATSILRLQGTAVVVYGALLGGAKDPVLRTLDDNGRSLPLNLDDSAINAAGAACDIILAQENNLEDGVHTLELTPYGGFEQIMAIFSAKIFDAPLVTTTSSAPSTKPTSTSGSSSPTATPPRSGSRSGSGSGSSTPSFETATGTDVSSGTHDQEASRGSSRTLSAPVESDTATASLGTVPSPSGKTIPIASIVVPVVLILLLAFFAVLWWWLRRSRRLRQPVQPYAPPGPPSSSQPGFIPEKRAHWMIGEKAVPSSDALWPEARPSTSDTSDPQSRAQEKMRRLNPKWASLYNTFESAPPSSSAVAQGTPTSNDPLLGGSPSSSGSSSGTAPAPGASNSAQMQALNEAMQRAGFSAQALLESLNRVHAHADPEIETSVQYTGTGRGRTAGTMPPQYQA